MVDLGSEDKEIDERRVVTDPLDGKHKKIYENKTSSYKNNLDLDED
jgi:hypothetical protein